MLQKADSNNIPFGLETEGGVFVMSKKGKVRYNPKCDRFFVDLYWQGKRHHIYKYLGRMPCQTEDMAAVLLRDIRRRFRVQ